MVIENIKSIIGFSSNSLPKDFLKLLESSVMIVDKFSKYRCFRSLGVCFSGVFGQVVSDEDVLVCA